MVKKSKVTSQLIHDQPERQEGKLLTREELTRVTSFFELLAKIDQRLHVTKQRASNEKNKRNTNSPD